METVEVVIRIPKDIYETLKADIYPIPDPSRIAVVFKALLTKGTVLPKGHGELKDMNDLCYTSRYGCKGNCNYLHTCNLYGASTIIEADSGDTDGTS